MVVTMQPIRNANCDDLYTFFCHKKVYQGDRSRWCIAGVVCEFESPSRYCKYAVPFPHYHLRSLTYTETMDTTRRMPQGGSPSLMQFSCFGERKPHVLSTRRGLLDNISEEMSDFLSEVLVA